MAMLYGSPPKVIWLRCGNQPTEAIEKRLRDQAEAIADFEQDDTATWLGNLLISQCTVPAYFLSPASTRNGRWFCRGGKGQVAKFVKAQGGL
jgi:hypothetical protein